MKTYSGDSSISAGSGKADGAMLTIGEASALLGVKPHILRYWEAQFDLLQPLKRAGGRRYYRAQDVALLRQIDQLLNREGFTVRGARLHLDGLKRGTGQAESSPATRTDDVTAAVLSDDAIAQLRQVRDTLAEALAAA